MNTAITLNKNEITTFNNAHNPEAEAFEIELDFSQLSTWDDPYKLFVNGELVASFKSFNGIHKRALALIAEHDLKVVRDEDHQ